MNMIEEQNVQDNKQKEISKASVWQEHIGMYEKRNLQTCET